MKSSQDMIKDAQLWAGLNRPEIALEQADVVTFGVPYDGGVSFRAGAAKGPMTIRALSYAIDPFTENFESLEALKVLDRGDALGQEREEIFANAKTWAQEAIAAGKLLTVIGGDHSITIPVLQGIDQALDGPLGILHFDAHLELCPEIGGNPLSHCFVQSRSLELSHVDSQDHIFFVGTRAMERGEFPFYQSHKLNMLSMRELAQTPLEAAIKRIVAKLIRYKYVYMTIDISVLDPGIAPGTGCPQPAGMDLRQLLTMIKGLFVLPIIGFDVVEVAPPLDTSGLTSFAARKLILETWGLYHKKQRREGL